MDRGAQICLNMHGAHPSRGCVGLALGLWTGGGPSKLWARAGDKGWARAHMALNRKDLVWAPTGPPELPPAWPSCSSQASPLAQLPGACIPPSQPLSHTIHGSPRQRQRACAAQRRAWAPCLPLPNTSIYSSTANAHAQRPCRVPACPQAPAMCMGLGRGARLYALRYAFASIRATPRPSPAWAWVPTSGHVFTLAAQPS